MTKHSFMFFLIVSFCPLFTLGQQAEFVKYSFFAKGGDWCSNYLTLYSNGKFYWAGPCENDIAISTGKWQIKNNQLYLTGEDSVKAYPKSKVTLHQGIADKIKFKVTDRYEKPYKNFGVTMMTQHGNHIPYWTDSTGTFSVDKGQFAGFYLDYQVRSPMTDVLSSIDTLRVFSLGENTNEVTINVDFPSFIFLDRGITLRNFGNYTYYIRKGNLYTKKGKLLYKLIK